MKHPSLRLLASRKFWQRSVFALACLATLIVAAYAIENYRGEKAWARYRADAEARGAKLDFKDFIPSRIPDGENFAGSTIYRELLSGDPAVRERARKACELPVECGRYIAQGEPVDFPAIGKCMIEYALISATTDDPVADVLRGLERYEPVLNQLREGLSRPRSRLDGEWEKGSDAAFWNLGGVLQISQLINLRVAALQAKGQAHDAWIDWRVGHRHASAFQGQPTLLACMLRVMLTACSTNSIQRGLAAHIWSDQELSSVTNDLATIDLMSDFTFGVSSERAFSNNTLDLLKANPRLWTAFNSRRPAEVPKWSWAMLIPPGWFAQNQLRLNEWYDQHLGIAVASEAHPAIDIPPGIPADILPPNFDDPSDWIRFPYWFFAQPAAYMLDGNRSLCREIQTNVDLSLVACALERFRLRNGDYPKELHELMPSLLPKLPRDRFDGQALRFRRADGSGVILYSVGKDCWDGGGDDSSDAVWRSTPVEGAAKL